MEILQKEALNALLGKKDPWSPKTLVGELNYVSGIPPFDILLNGVSFNETGAILNLTCRPNGLEIELVKSFKWNSIGILSEDIITVHLEDKEQIFETKEKSVIGRAVVGGLLLGPVGAIVGGMSGIGTKEEKLKMPDMLLTIVAKDGENERLLVFSCKYKNRGSVEKYLKQHFKEKFQRAS